VRCVGTFRLGHVPSKTAHGVADLRHGVDSNIEKFANQRVKMLARQGRLKWKHTRRQDPKSAIRELM